MFDYNSAILLPNESARAHESDRKMDLSAVERVGLKKIFSDFVNDYEATVAGVETSGDIYELLTCIDSNVEIIDGDTNAYIVDHYAIESIWTTNGGAVCLTGYDLTDYSGDDSNEYELIKDDLYSLPRNLDLYDFARVVFKLN